jgi:hypothetical protein
VTINWIEERWNLSARWPANSPDLNPIELLCASLKNIASKQKPGNIDELKQVLLDAWIQFHNQPSIGCVKVLAQDYRFVWNRMENRSVSTFGDAAIGGHCWRGRALTHFHCLGCHKRIIWFIGSYELSAWNGRRLAKR